LQSRDYRISIPLRPTECLIPQPLFFCHRRRVLYERRGESQYAITDLIVRSGALEDQRCSAAFIRTLNHVANRIDGDDNVGAARVPEARYTQRLFDGPAEVPSAEIAALILRAVQRYGR
jgi:hypothetical protein